MQAQFCCCQQSCVLKQPERLPPASIWCARSQLQLSCTMYALQLLLQLLLPAVCAGGKCCIRLPTELLQAAGHLPLHLVSPLDCHVCHLLQTAPAA